MHVKLLEERLLKLRGRLSKSKQIPGYQVFGANELKLLIEHRPTTIEQLAKLKGFPPEGYRVTKLGAAILAVFTASEDRELDFKWEVDGEDAKLKVISLPKSTAFAKR